MLIDSAPFFASAKMERLNPSDKNPSKWPSAIDSTIKLRSLTLNGGQTIHRRPVSILICQIKLLVIFLEGATLWYIDKQA
jgi:hypothetical protein